MLKKKAATRKGRRGSVAIDTVPLPEKPKRRPRRPGRPARKH